MWEKSAPDQLFTGGGKLPGLDGIRAVAILLVLFYHTTLSGDFAAYRFVGFDAGSAGVVVFFVLSGYLITTLLLREEKSTGKVGIKNFYLRRALRLFPALWLYLAVLALLQSAGLVSDHPWRSYWSSLFYVRNLVGRGYETNHLWSLSIEEQFYLLWPLFFMALRGRNRSRLLLTLGAVVVVTGWRMFAANRGLVPFGTLYMRSDFRFDAPLIGCALALAMQMAPGAFRWAHGTPWRSNLTAVVGVLSLVCWVFLRWDRYVPAGLGITAVCGCSLVLILSQIGIAGPVSRLLGCLPLAALGKISYGVYLWQQLFLAPPRPGLETLRTFPWNLFATLVVALLSYWIMERPLLRIKDRYLH